ncbi:MAG TPA: PilN domain-containing protein [Candidatus Paceibacterota bacterium]|nr:PilN domain-containing protein [Candidatus Paceibacterota bacterium]
MFTLLPENFKKDLMKEYRTRLAVVSGMLLLLLLVSSIILFLPSYITATTEHAASATQEAVLLSSINAKTEDGFSKTLDDLKQDIDLITTGSKPVSPVIEAMYAQVTSGITINSVDYSATEDQNFILTVTGVASSRNDLSRFAKELQKEESFAEVNLPIANLAKDVNAPFTIAIIGKQ